MMKILINTLAPETMQSKDGANKDTYQFPPVKKKFVKVEIEG